MLATFVIGLREGLEAALIVGIIAAFLRTNGRRLTAMWLGVTLAVLLSLGVGIGLAAIEQSLPQAAQEGMETVIGAVAVVFVTGMIVWMHQHSRGMRAELEAQAGAALHDGHAYALAVMAFLAVLKEGFETSVFLLATFSASTNPALAATGAVLGILAAVGVGIGIYFGGVKLNLSRFFRITGGFLILVAAGLVVSMLRTAHEAGWIQAGQQRTIDLSWLVTPGSVTSALITGVLGIPADPRLIELVGWVAFAVPVALFVYWPHRRRPKGAAVAAVQLSLASAAGFAAFALAAVLATAGAPVAGVETLVANGGTIPVGTIRLEHDDVVVTTGDGDAVTQHLDARGAAADIHAGVAARLWTTTEDTPAAKAPSTLSLDELRALSSDRLPIGISGAQQPGPFDVTWHLAARRSVWIAAGVVLDAAETVRAVAVLSGGGLATPRTVTLSGTDPAHPGATGWNAAPDEVQHTAAALIAADALRQERMLWGVEVPLALFAVAVTLLVFGLRTRRRLRAADAATAPAPRVHEEPPSDATPPAHPESSPRRSTIHANS